MHLFFDTETTGRPKNKHAPAHDLNNWPRIVSIGWLLLDDHYQEMNSVYAVIKPDGFSIPRGATAIHGISTEHAESNGVALKPVLDEFVIDLTESHLLIDHNIAFDVPVLGAEFRRVGPINHLDGKTHRCTMAESTDHCRIKTSRGFKWPTFDELHRKLFKTRHERAHNALDDVRA